MFPLWANWIYCTSKGQWYAVVDEPILTETGWYHNSPFVLIEGMPVLNWQASKCKIGPLQTANPQEFSSSLSTQVAELETLVRTYEQQLHKIRAILQNPDTTVLQASIDYWLSEIGRILK